MGWKISINARELIVTLGGNAMTADKRTVHTDALETLGMIITDKEKRDAIHLAVEPVICGDPFIKPGEHIGFIQNGKVSSTSNNLIGIADPFIKDRIWKDERFWLIVYPRQITSLRHVWEHPDFPTSGELLQATDDIENSIQWIRAYAKSLGLSYPKIMGGATDFLEHTEYMCEGPLLEGIKTNEEFWDHYKIVTGKIIPEDKKGNFFSCSC